MVGSVKLGVLLLGVLIVAARLRVEGNDEASHVRGQPLRACNGRGRIRLISGALRVRHFIEELPDRAPA